MGIMGGKAANFIGSGGMGGALVRAAMDKKKKAEPAKGTVLTGPAMPPPSSGSILGVRR